MSHSNLFEVASVIAHRGAPLVAPENTIASLKKAKELGAQWVECDAMLTQDDVVVIFHDDTLERTTNGHGVVENTPYAVLKTLDAGLWFDPAFRGEKIPTLKQFVAEAARLELGINIELKMRHAHPDKRYTLAKAVLEVVQLYSTQMPILLSSFIQPLLGMLQKQKLQKQNLSQNVSAYPLLGLNMIYWDMPQIEAAVACGCYSVHLLKTNFKPEQVAVHKKMGLETMVYTVNDPLEAHAFFKQGVIALFSDDPQLLSHPTR